MQRYECNYISQEVGYVMCTSEDGSYVHYEAAAALEAENAALREKLAAAEARTVLTDEPTMLWDADEPEDGTFAESGADFARAYADNLTPGDDVEVEVLTAIRSRKMSMRIILKPKGYEGDDWFTWEWIDGPAVLAASAAPAAQEDAGRLDWLARHGAGMRVDGDRWYIDAPYHTGIACVDDHVRFPTVRQAIDAAIAANTPKGT